MKFQHIVAAYLIVAVCTFGPAYNLDYTPPANDFSKVDNTMRAILSAALWPLYLSYHFSKGLRP